MYANDGRPQVSNIVHLNSSAALETHSPLIETSELPAIPRTAGELAKTYGKSDRAIQGWYKIVCKAYPWLKESDLKTGRSNQTKYTVLCQELIQAYRQSGMGADEWVASIHEANVSKLPKEPIPHEKTLQGFGLLPEQTLEVEVMQDGPEREVGIELYSQTQTFHAVPILQLNLHDLQIIIPRADTTQLDTQTAVYQDNTAQAVNLLAQFVQGDLEAKLRTVLAQNSNVAAGIQNAAILSALQNLGMGKPVNIEESSAG